MYLRIIYFLKAVVVCLIFSTASVAQQDIDTKVEALLSRMTLEEKAGQMTQLTIDAIIDKKNEPSLDKAKLHNVIVKNNVGSILNVATHAYTLQEWNTLMKGIQDVATKQTRLKIPILYGIDAIHGVTYTLGSTLFPQNISLAATRNTDFAFQSGSITAKETRASGIRWNFAPVLDLGREPLWPRFPETYGEDPYLIEQMGVNSIKGQEGSNVASPANVAACMKHYIGYSAPASGKDRTPAYIPEIILREYYLPQFKKAVEAGVKTVMINSAEINGIPTHANKYLLTDVLRTELGFKGVAVSDWQDIIRLHTLHHIATTPKEAVKLAVNAGVDMSMVPYDLSFYNFLIELVKEGQVSGERIDEAVRRILKLKYELGFFENPYPEKEAIKNFGLPEYKTIALEAARESIVLAKNEGNTLPFPKDKKILVTGPAANSITSLSGSWSYTWQGTNPQYFPKDALSTLAAIKAKAGEGNVTFVQGATFTKDSNTSQALEAAKTADYIVICLGEDSYAETPGNIDDLTLPDAQLHLAKALYASGKPVVLIFSQGRPRIFNTIEPQAKGIIIAMQPGPSGGQAIADILFGDYNPNGILPFTYPKFTGDIKFYDYKFTESLREFFPFKVDSLAYNPQFAFGHGLSYTTFAYSNLKVSNKTLSSTGNIKVSVDVKNSGAKAGKVAVELYTRDKYASITPNIRRLRKFKKVSLAAGQQQIVEFELTAADLAFVNAELKTVTEPGEFEIFIGDQIAKFDFK